MILLSIVIPTYNEEGNVALLAERLMHVFEGVEHEIIFVDDNSPDGTAGKVRLIPGFPNKIKLVERPLKLGLASAVMDGTKAASGEWILVMDADLSHPPETAKELFNKREKADLVIASRHVEGGGAVDWHASRNTISKGAEMLCRPMIGNRTTDPLSGFFLVKREMLLKTRVRVKGYKILLNVLNDNPKMAVLDVPYIFKGRHSGKTKLNASEIANYLFDLLRLKLG